MFGKTLGRLVVRGGTENKDGMIFGLLTVDCTELKPFTVYSIVKNLSGQIILVEEGESCGTNGDGSIKNGEYAFHWARSFDDIFFKNQEWVTMTKKEWQELTGYNKDNK